MIVINDAWRLCPDADVLYACDWDWWNVHGPAVIAGFKGERLVHHGHPTPDAREIDVARRFGLTPVPGAPGKGLGTPPVIHQGENSGYQALNVAHHRGAGRILMLGYDMRRSQDERSHFFGDHPKGLQRDTRYHELVPLFDRLAADLEDAGVEVLNCTRSTALKCFARTTIDEVKP